MLGLEGDQGQWIFEKESLMWLDDEGSITFSSMGLQGGDKVVV